jgi:hypothetical protein
MKKKMLGTYTLQDFPPAPVQEIMASMVGPILGALNKGAHPNESVQIPLGNMASMLHTIYLMAHQYENILNLLYGLKDQDDLAGLFEKAKESPTHQGIWNDYQDLRRTITEHLAQTESQDTQEADVPTSDLLTSILDGNVNEA